MDFFKIHRLRWTLRRYKRIKKKEALINLIHVQEGLVRELPDITKILE